MMKKITKDNIVKVITMVGLMSMMFIMGSVYGSNVHYSSESYESHVEVVEEEESDEHNSRPQYYTWNTYDKDGNLLRSSYTTDPRDVVMQEGTIIVCNLTGEYDYWYIDIGPQYDNVWVS